MLQYSVFGAATSLECQVGSVLCTCLLRAVAVHVVDKYGVVVLYCGVLLLVVVVVVVCVRESIGLGE